MSGGYFDHEHYKLESIADSIEDLIREGGYSTQTLELFKLGLQYARRAYVYAQRIDYLVSGDDGEATFLRRLSEDLLKLDYEQDTK